ncbi:PBP1A family penicillin-binding protein [Candidatus Daviesbacteria bacterium]|nr:PBP1A family penicillin-binding protein [Candidatus Daviesbacteria bacterium]
MPRRKKSQNLKPTLPFFGLLLVQIILIKVGQIPFWIVKQFFYALKDLAELTSTIIFSTAKIMSKSRSKSRKSRQPTIPNFSLFTFHFKLPRLKRSKGRPRTTPFIPFYIKKAKAAFNLLLPKPARFTLKFVIILTLIYLYTQSAFSLGAELPSPERLKNPIQPLTTEFYDREGKLLYRIYEGRNRTLINLSEVPSYLIQATLASEDQNFYSHPGVDFLAILRAAYVNLRYGQQEGASTLTQQLIKNTLLTPEKTYIRKIKEIILSLWAERLYAKAEILQMYLNEVPYGGTAWGIEAASETYFGRKVGELTLAQAAFLAGLPASPTQFSPYGENPELAKLRQRWVLDRMVKEKYITSAQADEAYSQQLHIKPPVNNIKAPHFVMYVKDLLSAKFGPRVVSQGGLKVYTSLDLSLQEEVERIVYEEVIKLGALNVRNGAAMVTDPKSGQILAMVGSKNYHDPISGSYNVTTALRQPGSSIKPVTYATAFKQGYSPGNTILDVPTSFKNPWGASYSPVNYDGKFHGAVSLRTALAASFNMPAVKLAATVGIPAIIETAQDMGITTFTQPERYGLSLTLGGAEVKMVDMITMYGTLANLGKRVDINPILKIVDGNGNIIDEAQNQHKQAISPQIAYLISHILADNAARTPAFGPNSQLLIKDKTVSVKTGTTDLKRDNWTFGYTEDFVVGTWVGNNDNSPMRQALTSGVTGAAPIWKEIMALVLKDKPNKPLALPVGIIEARVDGRKDLVITDSESKSLVRYTQKDGQTFFTDPFSSLATPSAQQAQNQQPSSN